MPDPNDYDDRDEFISDCISQSVDEGYDQDEAVGRCNGIWENRNKSRNKSMTKAKWSTAYINDLPDSAFLYIESGGEEDDEGKTKPRSLRHFPYKDSEGNVDLPHVRNAISRIPQAKNQDGETLSDSLVERLQSKARGILEEHSEKVLSLLKEVSMDDEISRIRTAWLNQFEDTRSEYGGPWPEEVFDTHLVVEDDGEFMRYPYSENDDGSIEFGEPIEVERLYRPKSLPVKVKSITDNSVTLVGYGHLWGSAEDKDLEDDFFTQETDFWFDRITDQPMVLYDHGANKFTKNTIVGKVVDKKADEVGLFLESELDRSNDYIESIIELSEQGRLGYSSGAVSHLVERTKDGWLKSWPIVEYSLTTTPAEPRLLGAEALRSLAQAEPAYKALVPEDDLSSKAERERMVKRIEIEQQLLTLTEMEENRET